MFLCTIVLPRIFCNQSTRDELKHSFISKELTTTVPLRVFHEKEERRRVLAAHVLEPPALAVQCTLVQQRVQPFRPNRYVKKQSGAE